MARVAALTAIQVHISLVEHVKGDCTCSHYDCRMKVYSELYSDLYLPPRNVSCCLEKKQQHRFLVCACLTSTSSNTSYVQTVAVALLINPAECIDDGLKTPRKVLSVHSYIIQPCCQHYHSNVPLNQSTRLSSRPQATLIKAIKAIK